MSPSKQILICITQVLCVACFAQTKTIDSLKNVLPFLKDSARIDCLNELSFEFSNRYWSKSKYQQTDTAHIYAQQAQNESQQLQYQAGIGMALQNMGVIEEERGNFKTAQVFLQKALPILQKEKRQTEYRRARIFLGWILYNRGFLAESIKIYKNELLYYEDAKETETIAVICRMIARAYDFQGNSEKAFTYFQKDFQIKKRKEDAWGKRSTATLRASVYLAAGDTANAAFCYKQAALSSFDIHASLGAYHSNLSIAFTLEKKYDSALLEIRENITEFQSLKKDLLFRKVALMINYSRLIDVFLSLKKFDSAVIYSRQPLSFFKKGDYVIFILPILKAVAAAYHAKKENTNALFYTNQLLFYAKGAGAKRFERDGYELLWQIYAARHKADFAANYHLKYVLLNDSLQNDKYISQKAAWQAINDINLNELKFENHLKINEERSKAKIEFIGHEKETQLYVFVAAIALLGLLTTLIIGNYRLKIKKDQLQLMMTEANISLEKQKRQQDLAQLYQQKTELELRALRSQMNPHFIFNCLNSINRFIINNEATKAADYLTKFAKLIRIVLEQSGKSFVTLEDELKFLKLYMDLEALRFEIPFQYEINCNGTDTAALMIPTLLVQPFIENAIWHGLHGKSNGRINIDIRVNDSVLHCKISDNGIGRELATAKSKSIMGQKSLGINFTQRRLQLINTSNAHESAINIYDLENDEGYSSGTCVEIKIPAKEL